MRPTFAASLALALTASLLPGAALASPEADSGREQVAEAVPDEHLDLEYGLVTSDPEDVAVSEPTVVTSLTEMPAAETQAEVYPMPSTGYYTVTGGGWGHRIGMSQYGAHGAGIAGLTHDEILDFYYPGTSLETRDIGMIRIGITIDNDGTTRVDHRSGLAVSHGTSGTTYTLPEREQWRVRATSTAASSCVLEGYNGSSWSSYWPSGMPTGCPVTFSSPTEGTVDLYLPSGSRRIYRGQLTATHRGSSSLATVNRLPMQHYLRSVVSIEMSPYFHQQALRAQSVAARTYAERGVNGTGYYDTCDTTSCQAYRGRGARQSDGGITSYEYAENTAAVDATNGQVLTYNFPSGKALATTMYAASTGGWTIPGGSGHPYLKAQADPYDNTPLNTRHRWTAQLTATSLEARYGIHDVTRVQVTERDGHGQWGGRILSAKVEGYTSGGNYTYANASGIGLYLARPWPNWNTGLSSDYFTFGDPGEAPAPPSGEVTRIAGGDRYETASEVSKAWAAGVSVVYVVSGENYADALAAAARAGIYDAPVLLTRRDSIPSATRSALTRLKPGRLVVVGGTGAVTKAVEDELRTYSPGTMQRVGGADRYETAADLASYYASGQSRVFLASGENFPDALAAAALAGKQHTPLLLTRSSRLDAATLEQLDRLNPGEVVVLGGSAVISTDVAQQAADYATSGSYRRLSGANRYETAAAVAQEYPGGVSSTFVASGLEFPDALVGAALAGRRGVPVVLTLETRVHSGAADALEHLDPYDIHVLGGTGVVSDATLEALESYLR